MDGLDGAVTGTCLPHFVVQVAYVLWGDCVYSVLADVGDVLSSVGAVISQDAGAYAVVGDVVAPVFPPFVECGCGSCLVGAVF